MKKLVIILAVIAILLTFFIMIQSRFPWLMAPAVTTTVPPTTLAPSTTAPATMPTTAPTTQPTTEATTEPTTVPPTTAPFEAYCIPDTDPANWNIQWDIMVKDAIVTDYVREDPIFFEDEAYFKLPGVASFRGGHYRNEPGYGTADIESGTLRHLWYTAAGFLDTARWNGCAWTGQPLVVQWDEETKQHMNMYAHKKNKEGLVEVIYAKMDGRVHFFDMEDGTPTRDPMFVGMIFKGSGALDPRGYPILYVGSGIKREETYQTMYIINLLDCTVMEKISGMDLFSHRWWFALDASPLVDAETDTLIWPSESGVLYTFKLNTQYDLASDTLTVDPDPPVKTRYNDKYTYQGRYHGYESSPTIVGHYAFIGDNAGLLKCVDLNTMQIVWAQDLIDDINATPVFDWGADGNGYLYVAPSLDYSNGGAHNMLPICKLDARTGEILWKHEMRCETIGTIAGGALASPLVGRPGSDIENLIIFAIGRSPTAWEGQVLAMDKETGEIVWQFSTASYVWSSPVALYTEEGKSYIFQADQNGHCYVLDGITGKELSMVNIKSPVESSPVVFGDRIMLGTRDSIHLFTID